MVQVRRETLEAAYRFRIAIRPYGNVVRAIAHVDPRRVWMDDLQTWVFGLQSSRLFLSLLPVPPQLLVCHHPLLIERWDPVRPGDDGLRNFQRGQRTIGIDGPCHHASDRQYRSHAFIRARGTSGESALACRT